MAQIWKPQTIEIYKSWVDAVTSEASDKLNDWESQFIANITMRLDNGIQLTQPQAEILERLYTEYTS
jgi:hypothetical protein